MKRVVGEEGRKGKGRKVEREGSKRRGRDER